MKRLILVGSPRTQGRSGALAEMLFEANIEECPEDELFLVPISEVEVGPCIGCDGCMEKSEVIVKGEDGSEVSLWKHRCVFDDDMQGIYDLLDDANEVAVVCPVYFSGAPAPFKCLLDRLQPYYWATKAGDGAAKRPAVLHVVGDGGDPHGYGALVSEVRASLAVAGFRLERLLDWVGCIDGQGNVESEAAERTLPEPAQDSGARVFGDAAGGSVHNGARLSLDGKPAGSKSGNGKGPGGNPGGRGASGKRSSGKKPAGGKPGKGKGGKGHG